MPNSPLVTVLLAVHDGEPYVRAALASVLRQTVSDIELLVVDDASTDTTPEVLARLEDPRVRVLRNDEQLGLAAALNVGLGEARGRYLARMDADDVAFPAWLARCLELLAAKPRAGMVGTGVVDVDARGRPGAVHILDGGFTAMRWRTLFSAPVFHDTVVLDRELLERHELRYDTSYRESEDYELWTRFLRVAEGDSVEAPLVVHRLHPRQASRRRGELQQTLAEDISVREIARLAPDLPSTGAVLARTVALGGVVAAEDVREASTVFVELLGRFEREYAQTLGEMETVRSSAARALARLARRAPGRVRLEVLREVARHDPRIPVSVAARRSRRRVTTLAAHRDAVRLLRGLDAPQGEERIHIAAVFPEPTPYRAPLLDRVAASPDVDLKVIYAAATVADRTWQVELKHDAVFLRGVRLPGASRLLHHDYPLTPGIVGELYAARPDVVVVSGWSTFAAQAAIAWCGMKDLPYVLVVESHDAGPRARWRRAVKGTIVPPVVKRAAGVLVTGTLARDSMIARGAAASSVYRFANTVDVEAFESRADEMRPRRAELRSGLGIGQEHVVILCVARLGAEKRVDRLVEAVSEASDPRLVLVVAGEGPERARIGRRAEELGVRLVLTGDVDWERIVELYAAADVFALLSEREPWAVVVNEAAACGLPLVLSDRVGAAHDLLHDGENGRLVDAGDTDAAATALRELASDPELRRSWGTRSRELAADWGYGPSVDGFLEAVREAVSDGR